MKKKTVCWYEFKGRRKKIITKQKRQKKTNKNFVSLDLVELPLLLQSTAVIFDCAKKTDNKRKKSNWISWQNEELSLWWSTSLSILCETDSILTNESTFSHNSAKRFRCMLPVSSMCRWKWIENNRLCKNNMKTSAVSLCVVLYTSRNYILNKAADTNIYLLMQLSVRFGSVQCWMMDKCGNQPCFLYI